MDYKGTLTWLQGAMNGAPFLDRELGGAIPALVRQD